MVMIQKRLNDSNKWEGTLTPYVKGRVMRAGDESRKFSCYFAGRKEYKVSGAERTWTVDLEKLTCDCREWQIFGVPCAHVVLCINHYCAHHGLKLDF